VALAPVSLRSPGAIFPTAPSLSLAFAAVRPVGIALAASASEQLINMVINFSCYSFVGFRCYLFEFPACYRAIARRRNLAIPQQIRKT
jgi:hypothetical protein